VLAWRAGRQLLDRPRADGTAVVVRSPGQAQVASAAELAVAARQARPRAGTAAEALVAKKRAAVSRTAGWISPVVLHRGRVVGTWEPRDGEPVVDLWPDSPPVPAERLDAELGRLRSYLKLVADA
jgi:hypothetical protein